MPIRIPDDLPARKTLEAEGVVVMDSSRAARQDIRPLNIGLLNLMPNKERTETQFSRLIGATPLQVELTLVRITDHQSKHTSEDYLKTFYKTWEEVREHKFDGFIVTGAPIANIPFEEVRYWPEMLDIMNWTQTNVHHTMFICWGAQAALHHFHDARRYRMDNKAFGVFRHKIVQPRSPWLHGFSDSPMVPVSRYNDIDRTSLGPDLQILIDNEEIGVCMIDDPKHRAVHMLNHLEYDNRSLADEYERDIKAGLNTPLPANLFPDGNPVAEPENRWRSHAHLLFQNWINEIYQTTPYDIAEIGK
ncbi:homoserine O-succinyltransferase [Youhaiella tibetensis]|uniref:Homoserine O-succinyltransferase n=1 Tax=Paradevosia tibetensis TaxID=1447062 RepID=A0A5B9DPB8_9HYPH|nr:homoserine O-succinyltransferase [Youhaiella tibetensis]AKR56217.1 Homoserine O-succinyltransferase [Devosia sp. H5989]QEE21271.1 homoserine O-succinyltransferase [Youhaiella tibetensis]GGF16452.1 homoserine O-succinyltransferase [Youhaiella tibetensis]